jgi:hypothetical protein
MKKSKFLKFSSFLLIYLMFFSIFPVKPLIKVKAASPIPISGFQDLYVISAAQVENYSAIVTKRDKINEGDLGNMRVVVKNGSISENVDLNIENGTTQYIGMHNDVLYFIDKEKLVLQSVDIKDPKNIKQVALPSDLGIQVFGHLAISIDKYGVIWITNHEDSNNKQFVLKVENNKATVITLDSLGAIEYAHMLENSSFFIFKSSNNEGLAKIDHNNNINVYDIGKDFNIAADKNDGIWRYNTSSVEKLAINDKNQLAPIETYALDSSLGYYGITFDDHNNLWIKSYEGSKLLKLANGNITKYELDPVLDDFNLSFDKNDNLWLNFYEAGIIFELVQGNFIERYNYDSEKTGGYTELSIYDENNLILSTRGGYLSYNVTLVDQLYLNAYYSTLAAISNKTQKEINEARTAINSLKGTEASWAIGEFSKQVDQLQNSFLVNICNAISKAEANLSQADINAAKIAIDPDLPAEWRNSYSSAVDIIQQRLMKKLADAVDKAVASKLKADIDAASGLITDVKTASDPAIASWADAMQKRLQN